MSVRYFDIRAPRPDFTEKIGNIQFVDSVARVSFDDTRDENGQCLADEHSVQLGRSAIRFAQRNEGRGYLLIETDEHGKPLNPVGEPAKKPTRSGKAA